MVRKSSNPSLSGLIFVEDSVTSSEEEDGVSAKTEFGAPGVPHPDVSLAECQLEDFL